MAPLLAALTSLLMALPVGAEDQTACVNAYVAAQTHRKAGELKASREQLRLCVQNHCSATLREQCGPWLEEVEAGVPSVVLVVTDEAGRDVLQIPVELDGEPWLEQVPPGAVEIDPGEHRLRVVSPAGTAIERRLVIREGEKNERVALSFSTANKLGRLGSWPVLVSAGVSAVALAGFGGLGVAGKLREGELVDSCAPGCTAAEVDDVRLRYLLADLSLGVAVVAAGAAVALWMLLPGEAAEETRIVEGSDAGDSGAATEVDPAPAS